MSALLFARSCANQKRETPDFNILQNGVPRVDPKVRGPVRLHFLHTSCADIILSDIFDLVQMLVEKELTKLMN
jgi:hypothetical protein